MPNDSTPSHINKSVNAYSTKLQRYVNDSDKQFSSFLPAEFRKTKQLRLQIQGVSVLFGDYTLIEQFTITTDQISKYELLRDDRMKKSYELSKTMPKGASKDKKRESEYKLLYKFQSQVYMLLDAKQRARWHEMAGANIPEDTYVNIMLEFDAINKK